ncbi:MAG: hypothetical protein ACRDSN_14165, partial [Pseudonocardiaceae bacterium]
MIDIALLQTDPDLVRRTATQRGADVDVDRVVEIDAQLRQAIARFTTLRTRQRQLSMSRQQVDPDTARAAQEELRAATDEVRALQELLDEWWARMPNLLAADTPAGGDESGNVELRREGDPVAADESRHHDTVGSGLGIRDLAGGAEVADSGSYYWHGDGARLAWAVFTHVQSLLQDRGCTPMLTPLRARDEPIGYYRDQILDAARLPIRVSAFSPQVGPRQSQAVEQLVLCRPEDSQR